MIQLSGTVLIQRKGDQWSCEIPAYDIDLTFNRTAGFLKNYLLQKQKLFPEGEGVAGDYPSSSAFFYEDYERETIFAVHRRHIWIMDRASGDVFRFERARFIEREEFVKTLIEIDADVALLSHEDILSELEPV